MHPLTRSLLLALIAFPAFASTPIVTVDNPVQANRVLPTFPVGKTLLFPITATDSEGNALTYKVASSNPHIMVRAKTGNPALRLSMSYGSGQTGDLVFQLFRDWTPITTGFVGGFAQAGFYNSLKMHRVVSHFVLQGGDPLGTGEGGPGMTNNDPDTAFSFENELRPGLIFTGRGQLAMANSGINTQGHLNHAQNAVIPADYTASNGSQFFVTLENLHVPTSAHQVNLDFKHTVFGQMLLGWDTMDAIAATPVDANSAPISNVLITSAKVEPDNHDAVLVLSATGAGNSLITLIVTDSKGVSATKTFTVTAAADSSNSPPFLAPVDPVVAPIATQYNVPLTAYDLESDYLFYNHKLLLDGPTNARSTSSGPVAAILGNAGYTGKVTLGVDVEQFNMISASIDAAVDAKPLVFGVGDRAVRPNPVTLTGAPGVSLNNVVVARIEDSDPSGQPGDFTATVNWGDGSAVESGVLSRDSNATRPGAYAIVGLQHTYAAAGIYSITVTATGNKGAVTTVRSPAIISSSSVKPIGQVFSNVGATVANRLLATFTDSHSTGNARDYAALVDWGDGSTSAGIIAKEASGEFIVRGTHAYKDAESYALNIRLHKASDAPANDTYAWSTATLVGFVPARHLPPFPVTHLVGEWSPGPTKKHYGTLTGSFVPADQNVELTGNFVIFNAGQVASQASAVQFFLSNDQTLDGSDTPLTVNGSSSVQVGLLAPNHGGSGSFVVPLPKGQSGGGKFLITRLVYSDPIIDFSGVSKIIVSPIAPSVLHFDQSGDHTTKAGGTVTFKVVLDTQPTADVTIPVVSSNTAEGTVSPAQLVFTSANWSTAQTVTVTGVHDAASGPKAYTVTLQASVSSDSNFNALPAQTLSLTNND